MNKKSSISLIVIIVLIIALLGTTGYIVYDKVIKDDDTNKTNNSKVVKYIKEQTVMDDNKFELELISDGKLYLKFDGKKEIVSSDAIDVYTCDIGQALTYGYYIDKVNDVYEFNIENHINDDAQLNIEKLPYTNIVAVANVGFSDAMHAVFIDKNSNAYINDIEVTDYKDENNYLEYLDKMTDYFLELFSGNEYLDYEYTDNILVDDGSDFVMDDDFNIIDNDENVVFEDAYAIWAIKYSKNKNYIYVLDDDGNLYKAKTDEYLNGNQYKLDFKKVNYKYIKKVLETEINDKNYAVLIDINNKAYVVDENDNLYK